MTTTMASSVYYSQQGPSSSSRFSMSAGTSERIQGILSSQSLMTPMTKRKVSFDESGGMSSNELDVTSRFLTSQYTTTITSLEAPRTSSFPDLGKTTTEVYWDSDSTSTLSCRKITSSRDHPCKPTVHTTMSRLSRSGCLCLLDGDTSVKRRRSVKGTAIPSVSEEDMTLDSTLEVPLENNVHVDDHLVASVSVLSPESHVQLQAQEGNSDSDHNNSTQPSYWGHFVDFLSPDPEEPKASCKYKRGNSFQRTRYRPYNSKTPTSAKQSFSFSSVFQTDNGKLKDEMFVQSNSTDDEEISRAIEKISL